MATLLELVQDATGELALDQPGLVYSSTSTNVRQFLALANAAGNELVKAYEWRILLTDYTFVTTTDTEYALPSGFDRLVNDTQWDLTSRWPGIGPASSQQWAWLNGQSIASVPRYRFRLQGNNFQVFPAPSAGNSYSYEYVSKNWILASDGVTYKYRFTADDDTHLYDDRLMVLSLKAKILAAKGLDSTIAQQEFIERLEYCQGHDKGAPTLSLGPSVRDPLISMLQIPDGSWSTTP